MKQTKLNFGASCAKPPDHIIDPVAKDNHEQCQHLCCDTNSADSYRPKMNLKETGREYNEGGSSRWRYFVEDWFVGRPWLTVCVTSKKALCRVCRYAEAHGLVQFRTPDKNFVVEGVNNWKKCPVQFDRHAKSEWHRDSEIAIARQAKPIAALLDTQLRTE
jgi:hypothetical protein